jgi:hypothetical protein
MILCIVLINSLTLEVLILMFDIITMCLFVVSEPIKFYDCSVDVSKTEDYTSIPLDFWNFP